MRPRITEFLISQLGFSVLLPDYVTMAAIAFLLGTYLTVKAAEKEKISPNLALNAILFAIIFGIVGSRLYFVLLKFNHYLAHPEEIIMLWQGGLASYGGFVGGFLAAALYLKSKAVPVLKFLDGSAIALACGVILIKIGCFMNGCDYGQLSTLPWAVRYPRDSGVFTSQLFQGQIDVSSQLSLPVHPTQLYDALSGVILLLVVLWLRDRKKFDGQLFLTVVVLYSFLRFTTEFSRGDHAHNILGVFSLPQIFALTTGLFALLFFVIRVSNYPRLPYQLSQRAQ